MGNRRRAQLAARHGDSLLKTTQVPHRCRPGRQRQAHAAPRAASPIRHSPRVSTDVSQRQKLPSRRALRAVFSGANAVSAGGTRLLADGGARNGFGAL
jgi:hypothetical protein